MAAGEHLLGLSLDVRERSLSWCGAFAGGGAAGEALLGLRGSFELRDLSLSRRCGGGCNGLGLGAGGFGGPEELVPLASVSVVSCRVVRLREVSLSMCALARPGGGMIGLAGKPDELALPLVRLDRERSVSVDVRWCFSGVVGLSASMSTSLSEAML